MNTFNSFLLCFTFLLVGNSFPIFSQTSLSGNHKKDKYIEKRINKIYSYDDKNQSSLVSKAIDGLFKKCSVNMHDSTKYDLLELKLTSLIRQSQYSKAVECCDELLNNYSLYTDSLEVEALNKKKSMYYAIKDKAPTSIKINGASRIASKRNPMLKLISLPVSIKGTQSNFLFDTGANYSVISREFAEKLGLEMYEVNIDITTPLADTSATLAFADSVTIGNVLLKNVVFLITPIPDLSEDGLVVNGIIGNNDIRFIPEIRILKSGEIYIPKKCESNQKQNLYYVDDLGLMPYVKIEAGGKKLMMALDTGATSSYLREYNGDNSNLKTRNVEVTVLGSTKNRTIKYFTDFQYSINGNKYTVNIMEVDPNRNSDGVIGQNFIIPHDCFIINNKNNYIEFK